MKAIELIRELQKLPQEFMDSELWVRVNINGTGRLDIAARVYVDEDLDVIVEGESQ